MKIDLKEYLQNRDRFISEKNKPGPVITISRQYGCQGTLVARKLIKHLNHHPHSYQEPWKYISKEILYDSAQELSLTPNEVMNVLHPHDRNLVEELFASLSTQYKVGEEKIHKTIRDIIMNYAVKGNVVILGQAGVAIARDVPRSLHVKLIAPLEWRAERLSRKLGISRSEAEERALEHDHRRDLCIDHFMGYKAGYEIFDLILNASTFSTDQMVREILESAGVKELAVV